MFSMYEICEAQGKVKEKIQVTQTTKTTDSKLPLHYCQ